MLSPQIKVTGFDGVGREAIEDKKFLGGHGRVAVDYKTVPGTALEHQDFVPDSGTLIAYY